MARRALYKSLEIYKISKKLAASCYELTHDLPEQEKTNFSKYIRAAALSVHVNIAQAAFRKSKKRKKHFREARKGLVVIDAAVEILVEVELITADQADPVLHLSSGLYQLLDQY